MEIGEIYCLTSPSNKKYIGQCVKLLSSGKKWGYLNRWKQHIRDATNGKDYCRLLNNAIRKYNPENFIVEIIIECDIKDLDYNESFYIERLNTLSPNGYNLTTGGKTMSRQSEETKELKRQTMIGKNVGKVFDKRQRQRFEDSNLPKYLRYYKDSSGKEGYRISHHPILKEKSFVSKYVSMEDKLQLALEYLNSKR
jgi:group I intron endonuclease